MAQETSPLLNPQRQQTAEPRAITPSAHGQRGPASPARQSLPRRAFYHLWRILPLRYRRLIVRLAMPRVTMGACAVIQDGRGHILIAHHLFREYPWGLPGGFVRASEQPADGLARELREELGVPAQVGPLLSAEMYPATRQLTLYYRATLLGTPCQDGVEIDDVRYAAPEEVARLFGDQASTCLSFLQA